MFLGILFSSIREIEVPYIFDWEHGTPEQAMHGIGPHLEARGMSHVFSRVAAGTCCIFSNYGWDGLLKLGFFLRSQDSSLVITDTSGI